ncbi:E3 ubiquitin-protein ligase TRIM39-like [Cheilinus undulatus]|uniref:E3 ubiquitin-protein ligase TRIM39-like n=1 Tax=Cheilinus undulatus TaxID=241271 RepID=UPI001BD4786E|nr:E3 ubiquitin-protein ligase TRIM39-like [Cheilinus undulatus]
MAAANCRLCEDQFLCPICLDVFTDPVSTPCGHSYCKNCITQLWDGSLIWKCPVCLNVFTTKPDLRVNVFISEMVGQFRDKAQQEASSSSEQRESKPGEVLCDLCTGTKLTALKSCLNCMTSYCGTHLEPHLTTSRLKRHQLIDPVENLEDRICTTHDKPLELFCKTDQTCICMLCSILDHKTHDFVPLMEEYEEKRAELEEKEAEIEHMIHKRRLKIEEVRHSVDLSKEAADKDIAEGVRFFTALMASAEKNLNKLTETVEEKLKKKQEKADDVIKELEQEIAELQQHYTDVEQLSSSEDHLHLIQNFPTLKPAPPTKDWTGVRIHPPSHELTLLGALHQLDKTLSEEMKTLLQAELKRVQQYPVDVTLDPDTAHLQLFLSDDGKQVHHVDEKENLPDTPERFSNCVAVLGKQGFSSGRFYYEVQVEGKTKWTLGVAKESINRKENIPLSPEDGYWTICLRNTYKALAGPEVRLRPKAKPKKVGVFVDYEEGLVSFYNTKNETLICSYKKCFFTEKLFPYFSPCPNDGGMNSAPLIITPLTHTE